MPGEPFPGWVLPGYEIDGRQACPTSESTLKVARWFGEGYNAWHVGKIIDVNKRRTKQDNITAEFDDAEEGRTWGHWCASADNYGADRQWVLLKPIPLDLDDMEVVADAAACK